MHRGQKNLLNEKLKMENGKLNTLKIFNFQLSIFNSRVAFTLAEVLITLAVIGIVAALTMPTLIQNYKKHVVETKLKKTNSILLQVSKMSSIDYEDNNREGFPAYNADKALEMFNKYYVPYMKFAKIEKGDKGIFAYLLDGTVWYFVREYWNQESDDWGSTYIFLCIDKKACDDLDENDRFSFRNGKNRFCFSTVGGTNVGGYNTYTRDEIIDWCKTNNAVAACSFLIETSGWKIPKDYPLKF